LGLNIDLSVDAGGAKHRMRFRELGIPEILCCSFGAVAGVLNQFSFTWHNGISKLYHGLVTLFNNDVLDLHAIMFTVGVKSNCNGNMLFFLLCGSHWFHTTLFNVMESV
jgi:hypothetical protein